MQAKIFISCGQREDLGEVEVANAIAEALANEGFDPYIAVTQQTLRGLKENIFEQLAESEYFLFIDFARESIDTNGAPFRRGSVFSQQELAVAAFLDAEVIAFQERGVKPQEGILRFMQTNPIPFADRTSLPEEVMQQVHEREWQSNWRKALSIDSEVSVHRDVFHAQARVMGDFYHLTVRNNHNLKPARNVYGYLDSVTDCETGEPLEYGAAEFKWAGYTLPNARIPANGSRRLDALWIPHPKPNLPQFNAFTDSTAFVPRLEGPGQWILEYSVASDSVLGSSRKFKLTLDGTKEGARLESE